MLDRSQLAGLFPRAPAANLDAFAAQAEALLGRFGISETLTRLQFFLAQLGHESGGLTVGAENMNYSAKRLTEVWPGRFPTLAAAAPFAHNPEKLANQVYANRMGNGPPPSGDGFRFRGRGYIQITGRDGYRQVGAIAGLDLEGNPDLALDPEHALLVACCFWRWKKLNPICDTGDFEAVTVRINGGTVGMSDRLAWLDKVSRIFVKPIAAAEMPPPGTAIAIQQALRARGFGGIGAADGDLGPRSLAAIIGFRERAGLPPGLVDPALLEALGIG